MLNFFLFFRLVVIFSYFDHDYDAEKHSYSGGGRVLRIPLDG